MSVDLPAPFSPQMAWTSAAFTVRETSDSALTPGNSLVIDLISRIGCCPDGITIFLPNRG